MIQGATFPRGTETWSRHQSGTLLRAIETMVQRTDLQAIADTFSDDCVIRCGAAPGVSGRLALRRLLSEQLSRGRDWTVQLACIAIDGNKLTVRCEACWTDASSGRAMIAFGLSVWTMQHGKIMMWEGAFDACPMDGERLPKVA